MSWANLRSHEHRFDRRSSNNTMAALTGPIEDKDKTYDELEDRMPDLVETRKPKTTRRVKKTNNRGDEADES